MFRIGVIELALTCGLILLVLLVPIMLARFYTRLDKRLEKIEKNLVKKKSQ